jgi:DNA-binding CsgD family transcriptional regulator
MMSGIDTDWLGKACARLGDTVIDPTAWPDIISEISMAAGATGGALRQGDIPTPDIPRSAAIDEAFKAYFTQGWRAMDIRTTRGRSLLQAGQKVICDQDIVTPEEMQRLPFYSELLARHGLRWSAAVAFSAGPALWALSLQRTIRQGPFDRDERLRLALMSQQLTDVATLSLAIGRSALSGATDALNAVRQPAVAIDRQGFVIAVNGGADALFDAQIRVKDRRLLVCDADARCAIESLLDRLRDASDPAPVACNPILVRRRDNVPVILRVLPVPGAARGPFLGARALLALTAVEPRPRPPAALLVSAFALTPAEARLASIIAEGLGPECAAEELRITKATARNQLKAVFAKTATRRQSELVALLSRLL